MINPNLLQLRHWQAYCDDRGSSSDYCYKENGNHLLFTGTLSQAARQGEDYPWANLHYDISPNEKKYYPMGGSRTIKIRYKIQGAPIRMFLKIQDVQESWESPSVLLPPTSEWETRVFALKDFQSPNKEGPGDDRAHGISGMFFQGEFQEEGGSAHMELDSLEFPGLATQTTRDKKDHCLHFNLVPNRAFSYLKDWISSLSYFLCTYLSPKKLWKDFHKIHGSNKSRSKIWDQEFSHGEWDFLLMGDWGREFFTPFVRDKKILDLGCGQGKFCQLFQDIGFKSYTGIDISTVAIEQARELYKGVSGCTFLAEDILSYQPEKGLDFIVLNEVVYYFSYGVLKKILGTLRNSLSGEGCIFIQIYNKYHYKSLTRRLIRDFSIQRKFQYEDLEEKVLPEEGIILVIESCP